MDQKEHLTLRETAKLIRIADSTLRKAICLGVGLGADLPYVRLGRRIIYRRCDIDAWLAKYLVRPPTK